MVARPPDILIPSSAPTQDNLPCDDGVPMETWRHRSQMELLCEVTEAWLHHRPDGFVSGNMFLYYSLQQVRNQEFLGPDYFVVLGVPKGERKSWVVWQEGKQPDVVIELLSASTSERDKRDKLRLYSETIGVPEYFWFDPFNPADFAGFHLQRRSYMPIEPDPQGRLESKQLGLYLAYWTGSYRQVETTWIRWQTPEGVFLPFGWEQAASAQQQATVAQERAVNAEERALSAEEDLQRERIRAEKLAQKLRQLGVDEVDLDS